MEVGLEVRRQGFLELTIQSFDAKDFAGGTYELQAITSRNLD